MVSSALGDVCVEELGVQVQLHVYLAQLPRGLRKTIAVRSATTIFLETSGQCRRLRLGGSEMSFPSHFTRGLLSNTTLYIPSKLCAISASAFGISYLYGVGWSRLVAITNCL